MKTIKVIDDKTIEVDGKRYAEVPESQTEFKVGQYIIADGDSIPRRITRATSAIIECDKYFYYPWAVRLAIPSEIEAHMKKEAEGRGYKPGVRFKSMNGDEIGRIRTIYANPFDYYASSDTLTVSTPRQEWRNLCSNPTIYEKGRWAEILPEKKKLPKTREEFMKFLGDYTNRHCSTVQNFLDQYED